MVRQGLVLAVLLLYGNPPAAQQPAVPQPTGMLAGQTIDGTSGKPVGGTIVTLAGGRSPERILTDAEGRFVFHSLPGGNYTLTATKSGYAEGAFGRRVPDAGPGLQISLGEGERKGALHIAVWKHAALGGTVVDEAGEPVIGVQVRVLRRAIVAGRTRYTGFGNQPITDDRGEYRVASLMPGDYVVGVMSTLATVPASLQDARWFADKAGTSQDLNRDLDRSAGILNRLDPTMSGMRVGGLLIPGPSPFVATAATPPPVEGGTVFVYPTVFYPASSLPSQATVISLESGQQASGIDFALVPVRTSRVSGELLGPHGPEAHTAMQLVPAGADEMQRDYDFETASTFTDAAGRFTFLGVPSGQYQVRALKVPPRPVSTTPSSSVVIRTGTSTITSGGGGPAAPPTVSDEPTLWANMPVSVAESDVTDLSVMMRVGARISGTVVFEGSAPKPDADRVVMINIQVSSADGRTTSTNQVTLSRGAVNASGQFKTYQQPAGRYTLRVAAALPGWTLKGTVVNGVDITDTPLELVSEDVTGAVITFTDTPTVLSGTVRTAPGVSEQMAAVLIFPTNPREWVDFGPLPRRLRLIRPALTGVYEVSGLPAGDYLIVAVEPERAVDWQTPAVLKTLAADATRVTLADAEKRSVDLTVRVLR